MYPIHRALFALFVLAAATAEANLDLVTSPPGRFASLGTHRIYYHCSGRGAPLVVIDAGVGGGALEWTPVQQRLARRTRVCTYDRAGYGWSDPGPSPRTTARAVAELRRLLLEAGEQPPWLLVGHSLGGFNMRYLAARHPAEVAALVLVDSSHPDELPASTGKGAGARHAIAVERLVPPGAEAPFARAAQFLNTRRKAVFTQMDELSNFARSAAQVRAAGALPAVPLVVIARDGAGAADAGREAHWLRLQQSLAALTADARLVVASGSDHRIHYTHPDLIAREVEGVLDRLAARPVH